MYAFIKKTLKVIHVRLTLSYNTLAPQYFKTHEPFSFTVCAIDFV